MAGVLLRSSGLDLDSLPMFCPGVGVRLACVYEDLHVWLSTPGYNNNSSLRSGTPHTVQCIRLAFPPSLSIAFHSARHLSISRRANHRQNAPGAPIGRGMAAMTRAACRSQSWRRAGRALRPLRDTRRYGFHGQEPAGRVSWHGIRSSDSGRRRVAQVFGRCSSHASCGETIGRPGPVNTVGASWIHAPPLDSFHR
jgi:hypothetical protein